MNNLGLSQTSSLSCAEPNCNKLDCGTALGDTEASVDANESS